MSDLKTLKDIKLPEEILTVFKEKRLEVSGMQTNACLRQEAIKWIKYYELGESDKPLKFAICEWIRTFFNITEKELMEKT